MVTGTIIHEGEGQANDSRASKEEEPITDSMRQRQIDLEEAQAELSRITL